MNLGRKLIKFAFVHHVECESKRVTKLLSWKKIDFSCFKKFLNGLKAEKKNERKAMLKVNFYDS